MDTSFKKSITQKWWFVERRVIHRLRFWHEILRSRTTQNEQKRSRSEKVVKIQENTFFCKAAWVKKKNAVD